MGALLPVFEVQHRIPRCLLRLRDAADAADLDGAGIQAWLDYEHEAMRYGIRPDVSREELVALIDDSTTPLERADHRALHSEASDFVRWGQRGGFATLERYGRTWYSHLARRRHGRISVEELRAVLAELTPRAGSAQAA